MRGKRVKDQRVRDVNLQYMKAWAGTAIFLLEDIESKEAKRKYALKLIKELETVKETIIAVLTKEVK